MKTVMSEPRKPHGLSRKVAARTMRWRDGCCSTKPQKGFRGGLCRDCLADHIERQSDAVRTEGLLLVLRRLSKNDRQWLRGILKFQE